VNSQQQKKGGVKKEARLNFIKPEQKKNQSIKHKQTQTTEESYEEISDQLNGTGISNYADQHPEPCRSGG
jgi:hypothetical protein